MNAATHNGTCQACGRQQASRAFGLSQHGYHTSFGYFHGVCHGSRSAPLEVSHELTDKIIADLTTTVDHLRKGATPETATLAGPIPATYREGFGPCDKKVSVSFTCEADLEALDPTTRAHLNRSYYVGHNPSMLWGELTRNQARRNSAQATSLASHAIMLGHLKETRFGAELVARAAR